MLFLKVVHTLVSLFQGNILLYDFWIWQIEIIWLNWATVRNRFYGEMTLVSLHMYEHTK